MKTLINAEDSPVIVKTRELCATILEQPGYARLKESIVAFLKDEEARKAYEALCDKQDELHGKQDQGLPITEEDDNAFEKLETAFMEMPVADGFIKAQQQMHQIEKTIAKYVRKTFELGRVPAADDLAGGCGPSCGCGG